MTEQPRILIRGILAIAAAAIVVTALVARFGTQPVDEDADGADREHGERIEQRGAETDERATQVSAAALALHPGRVLEVERKGGGGYEVEVVDDDGVKWKLRFDAAGTLVRERQDD